MEQYVNLVFTFHNVSINSLSPSLHRRIPSPFTFHNVSINSFPETNIGKLHKNHLHSIMYLLIQVSGDAKVFGNVIYIP